MTNPPLPEEIQEQIIKEANDRWPRQPGNKLAYCEAANKYASLALSLKERLKYIRACIEHDMDKQEMIDFITKALQLFPEQGKEGSRG